MCGMSITIVMTEGKTLHIQDATQKQAEKLRAQIDAGVGGFEFLVDGTSYVINCSNVVYIEIISG